MNKDLFQKINDLITLEPEKFDMTSWETEEGACGTTRCLAGWAIVLTTGAPIWLRDENGDAGDYTAETTRLARDLDASLDIVSLGAKLLEMDYEVAYDLFYTNYDQATRFTALAAEGEEDAAMQVLWGAM